MAEQDHRDQATGLTGYPALPAHCPVPWLGKPFPKIPAESDLSLPELRFTYDLRGSCLVLELILYPSV